MASSKVAALFVDPDGVYSTIRRVECWGLPWRDARLYVGGLPVVAHPPCATWGAYARSFFPHRLARDGGCFRHAIDAVLRCGGVLEHPAASSAWSAFELASPSAEAWTPAGVTPHAPFGAWTCQVDQGHYGHPAPKKTWLLYVGRAKPRALRWGPSPAVGRVKLLLGKRARAATPRAFAELLVELARDVDVVTPPELERVTSAGAAPVTTPASSRCIVCRAELASRARGRITCSQRCRQRLCRHRARCDEDLRRLA